MQFAAVRLLWTVFECTFYYFYWQRPVLCLFFVFCAKSSLIVSCCDKKWIWSARVLCHNERNIIMQRTFCAVVMLVVLGPTFSQDIFELTTRLDDPRFRFLFHGFRSLVFNSIGKTGLKTRGSFLQEKFPDAAAFPCNVSVGRSAVRPSSIHKLRPGGNLFRRDGYIADFPEHVMRHACASMMIKNAKPVDYPFFISLRFNATRYMRCPPSRFSGAANLSVAFGAGWNSSWYMQRDVSKTFQSLRYVARPWKWLLLD